MTEVAIERQGSHHVRGRYCIAELTQFRGSLLHCEVLLDEGSLYIVGFT